MIIPEFPAAKILLPILLLFLVGRLKAIMKFWNFWAENARFFYNSREFSWIITILVEFGIKCW